MFPRDNLDAQSQRWVRSVEATIETLESHQTRLDHDLSRLHKENASVMDDVTANINAYYNSTLAQYPAFQRTVPMADIFGDISKTVSISAPAAADSTVAENWVSVFSYDIGLPFAATNMGVRLNGAQFQLSGPTAYSLRFRWRVNTQVEGINTNRWMSRHQFNLITYVMDPTNPILTNIANRYVYRTGSSVTDITVELQVSIQNIASRSNAVASQDVTFIALNDNDNDTHLDVMITV
jgi:hypothetical protein